MLVVVVVVHFYLTEGMLDVGRSQLGTAHKQPSFLMVNLSFEAILAQTRERGGENICVKGDCMTGKKKGFSM